MQSLVEQFKTDLFGDDGCQKAYTERERERERDKQTYIVHIYRQIEYRSRQTDRQMERLKERGREIKKRKQNKN